MIEIIPAIDIIEGKCVRLTQGDYAQKKVYREDPLEAAKEFEAIGIKRLHLVDLDGARAGRVINLGVLERVSGGTKLVIDFGGGIKSNEDIKTVFDSGAAIATIGSVAVKHPGLFMEWINEFGPDRILLGADVKDEMIAVSGWQEQTKIPVIDFIRERLEMGVSNIFCTDISKDGLLQGPSVLLYEKILADFPGLNLVASGGVSKMPDVIALEKIGCKGVIIGKAIYEGRITPQELKNFTRQADRTS
ncbi:MAG TPA: 1-(5-phosphoribosyl)-5-[(5-phosphoribosylamino)methylideneamino]imidazole-4-carboxamide isomerase [Bacteroidia bacterium]|jgi:phosphoribosylformimino-5-aminoimidazole carboxamide ribotide isomerase